MTGFLWPCQSKWQTTKKSSATSDIYIYIYIHKCMLIYVYIYTHIQNYIFLSYLYICVCVYVCLYEELFSKPRLTPNHYVSLLKMYSGGTLALYSGVQCQNYFLPSPGGTRGSREWPRVWRSLYHAFGFIWFIFICRMRWVSDIVCCMFSCLKKIIHKPSMHLQHFENKCMD